MEKNKINQKQKIFPSNEELYQEFSLETIENSKKYTDIKLTSKILHYLKKPSFYYYCTVKQNTQTNPFNIDIDFCFEFIDKEIPYASLLTDFINISMNDNRNYYRCLTKEHNYIFYLDKFNEQKVILESMIEGIGNFLLLINESIAINTFIFFGEYEYNHIYQVNDFLKNKNYLNFYRINQIINKKIEEKYIIFSKLYFLLFEPLQEDKALIKLIFYQKLKDLDLSFDKNDLKDSLILNLSNSGYKDIEFYIINRKRAIKKKEDINLNKNEVKDKINNNEIKEKEKYNYSIIIKEWFTYKDSNNFKNYELVLNEYRMLFNGYRGKLIIKDDDESKMKEYNEYIQFYEKLVEYYENKKDKNNKERIHKLISEIIYICSELINYAQNKNWKENKYLLTVKKYVNSYK